jgi:hypothetical protein
MRRLALFILIAIAAAAEPGWGQSDGLADRATGCRVLDTVGSATTVTWSGPCVGGLAQGHGKLQYFNQDRPLDRYEGDMKGGRLNGRGTYILVNGKRYDGELRDGMFEGRGVYTYVNGDRYEGEIHNDNFHGQGTMRHKEGSTFVGTYANDLPHGFGKLTTADGRVYSGDWTNGCYRSGNRWATEGKTAKECGFK